MNMMNSGKVWDKMVWSSSHLQQLSKFSEKWSRQLESWDELFKWVTYNTRFLLNRNLRYRTNILSFSCQLNDFTTYAIAFQYSSALRNPLRYSRFIFFIFFSSFRHFLLIFGPTCPSRTVLILLLSERSSSLSLLIKIHMDGCFVPTNRFHLLWNPESIRKTNNLKNH